MKVLTVALMLVSALVVVGNANATIPECPGANCPGSVFTDNYLALKTLDQQDPTDDHLYSLLDHGFNPLTDDVYWAQLALLTSDDSLIDGQEVGRIRFQKNGGAWETEAEYNANWTDLIVLDVDPVQLQDGLLNVRVRATQGDFFLWGGSLKACAVNAVPEPMTMMLLGSGLLGLIGLRRKVS